MPRRSFRALSAREVGMVSLCGMVLWLSARLVIAQSGVTSLGVFEGQTDVGSVTPPGTAAFDPATSVYTVTAAGANLWAATDGFHFVWKKLSGEAALTADIDFPEKAGTHSPHRKAVLMFRQTLDADSAYADAAVHGSGLTALQYRLAQGGATHGIEREMEAPKRIRLEKRGDVFTVFLSMHGEPLHQVGETIRLHLEEPYYVGIGLTAHDVKTTEKAVFANLELNAPVTATPGALALYSTLQVVQIAESSPRADVVYTQQARLQAPNWSRDGRTLLFNRDGEIWSIPAEGGAPRQIDAGAATGCSGSHGFSPDGKWLAVTCSLPGSTERRVYVIPAGGGAPRVVTEHPDSWFHSWSPDGKTIAFTRPDRKAGGGNIFAIPAEGGPETALTSGKGISDDPDYSPDGKYIYFNSDRGGTMQIWRMLADGSQPEQMTFDELRNWTPHPSPDGKWVVFLSYAKDVTTHAANKDICLRLLSTADKSTRVLTALVGGDGSMNVPNWSPDSKQLAFVSYQMLPAEETGRSQ